MTTVDTAQALWLLLSVTGLALAVSYAGVPVLGQGAFMAVGAFGTALLGPGGQGWPLGIACATSVLAAGMVGYLVAAGTSRLDTAQLALATWALAWLVDRFLLAAPDVSGGRDGLAVPAPAHLVSPTLGLDLELTPAAHVVIASLACLLVLAALARFGRGPGALELAALRESPVLARSLGVPVASRRRTVLAATAALGAVSGAGSTVLHGLITPSDVSPLVSLQLLVAVLIGGTARWYGPLVGVAFLTALPTVADGLATGAGIDAERSRGVLTAVLLLLVLALRAPVRRKLARPGRAPATPQPPGSAIAAGFAGEVLLSVTAVTVRFGGVLALDDVAIDLRAGQVHALIGPNGSGKSTLLSVLAGERSAGEVEVGGVRQRGGDVRGRVAAGVVGTPQQTAVMAGLSAERQVAIGIPRHRGAVLRHLLATPRSRRETTAARVTAAMDVAGAGHLVGADPQRLGTGDQRLLQVARAVATGASVLLLDEPAAGMTADERDRLGLVLRTLAGQGRAVLLVEHDLVLVAAIADRLTVIDAGRVLATGDPGEVLADQRVRVAYLGTVPA